MESRCIVLADSHQNMLEGIRGLLDVLFDKVVMVSNLPSLFETVDKIKPEFAMVDVSLLKPAGTKTISEIKKLFPEVKLILLSFYNEPTVIQEVISEGVSGFVLKQNAGTDIYNAIENIRKGKIFVSRQQDEDEGEP